MTPPVRCIDVSFEMGDGSYEKGVPWYQGEAIGALLWNPKGGNGHVIVSEDACTQGHHDREGPIRNCGCGGYFGACESTTFVCECGEDNSWRDHHYLLLRK